LGSTITSKYIDDKVLTYCPFDSLSKPNMPRSWRKWPNLKRTRWNLGPRRINCKTGEKKARSLLNRYDQRKILDI
jgi:hypothetical protein